jgi:hypothetical protein
MVLKNIKYSEIENVTIIELGKGDVKVSDTTHASGDRVGVMFTNDVPNEIGTSHADKGKDSNEVGVDALITFDNIASLEVVEKALKNAKRELRKILKAKK